MARKHTLKLRELRTIRTRFILILVLMAAITLVLIAFLAIRVYVIPDKINYLDFYSLCFYGFASLVLTIAQLAFLRHLTVTAGRRIEDMTYADELTGLGNRRDIARFLAEEFHEAQLSRNPLSVLYMDLDDFKQVNDQHSHQAGDLILRAVALSLKQCVREADFVGRAGGDEFVVILPDTDSQCASVVARRIAERIAAIAVTVDSAVITNLTSSIGISSYPANANAREELIADADRTMYAAKRAEKGSIAVSIARPTRPEPKAPFKHVTTLEYQITQLVDAERRHAPAADPPERGRD